MAVARYFQHRRCQLQLARACYTQHNNTPEQEAVTMPLAYTEHYTVENYQHWKGDWELVEGVAFAMAPSPSITHQRAGFKITQQLGEKLEACKSCEALYEIDWNISNDTIVRPDVLVICYEPEEKITKAPELIFEVISPATARRDEQLKFELYQREGVPYYVLVYPEQKTARVYGLVDGKYRKVGDFMTDTCIFTLTECQLDFDFYKAWKR